MRFWAIQNTKNGKLIANQKHGSTTPRLYVSRGHANTDRDNLIRAEISLAMLEDRRALHPNRFKIVRVKLELIEDAWSKK